jgi:hypothetical protein
VSSSASRVGSRVFLSIVVAQTFRFATPGRRSAALLTSQTVLRCQFAIPSSHADRLRSSLYRRAGHHRLSIEGESILRQLSARSVDDADGRGLSRTGLENLDAFREAKRIDIHRPRPMSQPARMKSERWFRRGQNARRCHALTAHSGLPREHVHDRWRRLAVRARRHSAAGDTVFLLHGQRVGSNASALAECPQPLCGRQRFPVVRRRELLRAGDSGSSFPVAGRCRRRSGTGFHHNYRGRAGPAGCPAHRSTQVTHPVWRTTESRSEVMIQKHLRRGMLAVPD